MTKLPPSRYRIIEKGGRLIVYDRGVEVSSQVPDPPNRTKPVSVLNPMKRSAATPSVDAGSFLASDTLFEKVGAGLVRIVSKGTNDQGLTTLQLRTKQGNRVTIKSAQLDANQVKILARGLVFLLVVPLSLFVGLITGSTGIALMVLLFSSPLIILALVTVGPLLTSLKWQES